MRFMINRLALSTLAYMVLSVLTGCSASFAPAVSSTNHGPVAFQTDGLSGSAYGGNQAIGGATIQVYQVGTSGDGSQATPLLTTLTTTSDGTGVGGNATNNFNALPAGSFKVVDTNYCPAPDTQVYLTATGGNPGITPPVNNTAIVMLAILGRCDSISSSTHVLMNELTTVGSVTPMSPYIKDATHVGYDASSDSAAFLQAVALVPEYVATATGTVPGPNLPSGYYASSTEIDTLADVMASCVNSAGDSTSICPQLFGDSTTGNSTPSNIVTATANILNNPSANVTQIAGLAPTNGPFQPVLAASPVAWTLPILPQVATPVFAEPSGRYSGPQSISISDATPNANIYYTTDGTTPTSASNSYATAYANYGGVYVPSGQTVKAIATLAGDADSAVASATYIIAAADPQFSQPSGTYTSSFNVVIQSINSSLGATVYYTTNGTTPNLTSAHFNGSSGSLLISNSETVKAIAYIPGLSLSNVVTANYVIAPYASAPVLGFTAATDTLTMVTATTGAAIYYTTDGTTPTSSSILYTGPITVGVSELVQAIAVKSGYTNSPVTSQQYYIQAATPTLSVASGTYPASFPVTISSTSTGAAIYYTLDGTTPTTASNLYSGPVTVLASETVTAIATGNGYTSSTAQNAVYTIDPTVGTLTTIAGGGTLGTYGEGGPATSAALVSPNGIAVDSNGNVFFSDIGEYSATYGAGVIREVDTSGTITTALPGNSASTSYGLVIDSTDTIYAAGLSDIFKFSAAGSQVTRTRANLYSFNSGSGTGAASTIAVGGNGKLYFNFTETPSGGTTPTYYVGSLPTSGGSVTTLVTSPSSGINSVIGSDSAGNVYTYANCKIYKGTALTVSPVIAGTGTCGFSGDGGAATSANISGVTSLIVDSSGNYYISDSGNARVRKITNGVINTVAGGTYGNPNNNSGYAPNIAISPGGLALDSSGNLYIADTGGRKIRKVTFPH